MQVGRQDEKTCDNGAVKDIHGQSFEAALYLGSSSACGRKMFLGENAPFE
jgi:hypothetical protein